MENEISIDCSIPKELLEKQLRYNPAEDVVGAAPCLICETNVPLRRYESGPMICSKCKKAVMTVRKLIE